MSLSGLAGFLAAYVRSMRLYYAFITGVAGWLGVSYYQYVAGSPGLIARSTIARTVEVPTPDEKKLVILVILFLSWGINQVINDYLGLAEDRINAPRRPMVTGELDPDKALLLTGFLLAAAGLVTWLYLEPVALIPLGLGILLNVVYEHAKAWGILANVVFGLMISMCCLFGYFACGPTGTYFLTRSRISVLVIVAVMNGLMTFYTYFKDYAGDKAAGKRTVVVRSGLEKSRLIAVPSAFLPSALFVVLYFGFRTIEIDLNRVFVILGLLTVFLEVWTGVLYFRNPRGRMTYDSLITNFRACACGQAALLALFNPELGMMLFIFSYVFIGFLFSLHSDAKA